MHLRIYKNVIAVLALPVLVDWFCVLLLLWSCLYNWVLKQIKYNVIGKVIYNWINALTHNKFAIVECLCSCVDESAKLQHECSCFMFRFKRNNLVKRLWRLRLASDEGACKDEEPRDYIKNITHSMLKSISEDSLEMMVKAVESKGTEQTGCILIPTSVLRQSKYSIELHVLCCKLWRWADLRIEQPLRQLSGCSQTDDAKVCCNPFHWSRLLLAGGFIFKLVYHRNLEVILCVLDSLYQTVSLMSDNCCFLSYATSIIHCSDSDNNVQ